MKKGYATVVAAAMLLLAPAIAEAAAGYSTANVNMRSGPSTQYPAVTVIPAGESVQIHGCLADVPWCDVSFYGGRGWVAGRYVQTAYQQRRVYVEPQYYRPLGIPVVTFSVGNYWDRYYRGQDFYRDRDRWDRDYYRRPGYDRRPDYDRRPEYRPRDAQRVEERRDYRPNNDNRPAPSQQERRRNPYVRLGTEPCPPARPYCND